MAAKPAPKPSAKAKAPQLCKVRYDFTEWVLPVEKGLTLVALLKDAVPVRYLGGGKAGSRYKGEDEQPGLSLEMLKPGQFVPAGSTLH